MDDLLKVFLAETAECLVECQGDLERLRQSPDDTAALDNILRLIRSVRETSGFLGMPALQVAANAAIDGLEAARGRLPGSADRIVAIAGDSLAQIKTVVDGLATDDPAGPAPAVLATKRPSRKKKPAAKSSEAEAVEPIEPEEDAPPPSVALAMAAKPSESPASPREAPPAAVSAHPVAPADTAPAADGTVRVSAEMLENLLSTVSRLMAAQTEMMQLLKTKEPAAAPVAVEAPAPEPAAPVEPAAKPELEPAASTAPVAEIAPAPRDPAPLSSDGKVVSLHARQAAARAMPDAAASKPMFAAASPAGGAPAVSGPTRRTLIFHTADKSPRAVVLDPGTRVEEVEMAAIDGSRGLWVMRSGGELFPLVPFDTGYRFSENGRAPVIIFTIEGQSFGLLVDAVQDAGEAVVTPSPTRQVGRLGTLQIDGVAVDVIDPVYYLNEAVQTRFRLGRRHEAKNRGPRPEAPAIPDSDGLFVRKPAR